MSLIRSFFLVFDKPSSIKMGLGVGPSPKSIFTSLSLVWGSHCSKRVSHNVLRRRIQGSLSSSKRLSSHSMSSKSSNGLSNTMLMDKPSNRVPMLTSDFQKNISEE